MASASTSEKDSLTELEKELYSHIESLYSELKERVKFYESLTENDKLKCIKKSISHSTPGKLIWDMYHLGIGIERLRLKHTELHDKWLALTGKNIIIPDDSSDCSGGSLESPYQSFLKKTSSMILREKPSLSPEEVSKEVESRWKKSMSATETYLRPKFNLDNLPDWYLI
jgi:hypothetical protein